MLPSTVPPAAVTRTLVALTPELRRLAEPWWILGSAAASLVGADVGEVGDVDVLTSISDAVSLVRRWGEPCQPRNASTSARFRSALVCTSRFATPVEVMGGLQVCERGRWGDVTPETRWGVRCGGVEVFVPSPEEQISILRRFGRPKDHARADALARLIAGGGGGRLLAAS